MRYIVNKFPTLIIYGAKLYEEIEMSYYRLPSGGHPSQQKASREDTPSGSKERGI